MTQFFLHLIGPLTLFLSNKKQQHQIGGCWGLQRRSDRMFELAEINFFCILSIFFSEKRQAVDDFNFFSWGNSKIAGSCTMLHHSATFWGEPSKSLIEFVQMFSFNCNAFTFEIS